MRAKSLVPALAVILVAAGCSNRLTTRTVTLQRGAHRLTVIVELASTEQQRARGLMGRRSIPDGTGMLFLYPEARVWGGFWMKDTLVPLDVAFIRSNRVTQIARMEPCRADPCPLTTPSDPYDSALEVAAGTFARAGITSGAAIELIPPI